MLSAPKIRSRQINDSDVDGVADLLTKGFRIRSRDYWRRALEKLGSHPTPAGLPKYGYLLESGGVPVGVILLIFSSIPASDAAVTRCNVSSWYVEPAFRGHAALLISLDPGTYSALVRGADGGTGEALIEVYEVP